MEHADSGSMAPDALMNHLYQRARGESFNQLEPVTMKSAKPPALREDGMGLAPERRAER